MIVNITAPNISTVWHGARTQRHVIDSESNVETWMDPGIPLRKASYGPCRTRHTVLLFSSKPKTVLVEFLGQRVVCTEYENKKLTTVDINSEAYATDGIALLYNKMPQLPTLPVAFIVEPTIRDMQAAFANNNLDASLLWTSVVPNDLFSLPIDNLYIPDYASLLVGE